MTKKKLYTTVDEALHTRVSVAATLLRKSMNEVVIEAAEEYLAKVITSDTWREYYDEVMHHANIALLQEKVYRRTI